MKISRLLISLFAVLLLNACSTKPAISNVQDHNEFAAPTEKPTLMPTGDPNTAPPSTSIPGDDYADLEIITLLPQDAIPAIDDPEFLSASEAENEYAPEELVIGVEFNGDARAYSISYLSRFEIVNDHVGGVALSVTW